MIVFFVLFLLCLPVSSAWAMCPVMFFLYVSFRTAWIKVNTRKFCIFRHFGKNRAGNANGCRFMADSIVGSSSMTVELCIQSNQSFLRDSAFTRISQFSLQHSVKQTSHFKNGQKRGTNLKQKQVLISGRCTKTMIAHRFSWTAKL